MAHFLNDFLFLVGPSGRDVISLQKEDSLLAFKINGLSKKGFCTAHGWIREKSPQKRIDSI
jgi:hypothetical protein